MLTRIFRVNSAHPEDSVVREAVAVLHGGGLVALPTETVYGLAANASSSEAVQRIFEAKGRPARNPVIVHAADAASARQCTTQWPRDADRLSTAFWPGPLTLVLPRAAWIPNVVTASGETVAIRVPDNPVALAVLRATSLFLAAPSANRFQGLSPTRAEHVMADLNGRIDLVLDAGPTSGGIESTVVALLPTPRILRPGPITQAMLETILAQPCPLLSSSPGEQGSLPSPGLLQRHYAPNTPLEWADNATERIRELLSKWQRVAWLTLPADELSEPLSGVVVIAMPDDPTAYARRLYAELHLLDEQGLDRILVSMPPPTSEWTAIRDRIQRAANS